MYQPNIPAIYHELKRKNMMTIQKVLWIGTGIATAVYIMTGMFGYLTFAMSPDVKAIMEEQNILKADYNGIAIVKICQLLMLVVVSFAAPFCVLPSKDSVEEIMLGSGNKFSMTQNVICTLGILFISCAIAIIVPTIADAMTILGATTNSGIGFLIPIIFYLKIKGPKGGRFSNEKVVSYFVFVIICLCSIAELYSYIQKKKTQGS